MRIFEKLVEFVKKWTSFLGFNWPVDSSFDDLVEPDDGDSLCYFCRHFHPSRNHCECDVYGQVNEDEQTECADFEALPDDFTYYCYDCKHLTNNGTTLVCDKYGVIDEHFDFANVDLDVCAEGKDSSAISDEE